MGDGLGPVLRGGVALPLAAHDARLTVLLEKPPRMAVDTNGVLDPEPLPCSAAAPALWIGFLVMASIAKALSKDIATLKVALLTATMTPDDSAVVRA